MDTIYNLKKNIELRMEDPFWNQSFKENLPKWIHIWFVSFSLLSCILFCMMYLTNTLRDHVILKGIAILGILSSGMLLLNRDTFLPFLGETFLPEQFLQLKSRKPKKVEKIIEVHVKPNREVIYWAAKKSNQIIENSWKDGYGTFENSGIVLSDEKGIARLSLECPTQYKVHGYKVLPKHIHYRVFDRESQTLSRIYTLLIHCK